MTDDEWALVAPYQRLLSEQALQRKYDRREVYNGLRWLASPPSILRGRCPT